MRLLHLALLSLLTGCGEDECPIDTSYAPAIDPGAFVASVTNPLFPLVPGTVWTYAGGGEQVVVTVTADRLTLMGVSTIVVHDVGSIGGEVIEDTLDYYAQDRDGNVWYMGEDTTSYEDGETSTEGSWRAGVDGAQPGILIPAMPVAGVGYRQEYYGCEAEDMGKVVTVAQPVTVGTTTYQNCLQTEDTTPLEPDVLEHKFYCPTVGLVVTIDERTGIRDELVSKTP